MCGCPGPASLPVRRGSCPRTVGATGGPSRRPRCRGSIRPFRWSGLTGAPASAKVSASSHDPVHVQSPASRWNPNPTGGAMGGHSDDKNRDPATPQPRRPRRCASRWIRRNRGVLARDPPELHLPQRAPMGLVGHHGWLRRHFGGGTDRRVGIRSLLGTAQASADRNRIDDLDAYEPPARPRPPPHRPRPHRPQPRPRASPSRRPRRRQEPAPRRSFWSRRTTA